MDVLKRFRIFDTTSVFLKLITVILKRSSKKNTERHAMLQIFHKRAKTKI